MEDNVWRVFYVLDRHPEHPEVADLALKVMALSRCRDVQESGFSVITRRHVVQLLEAPSDTLPALLSCLKESGTARLLLSEASPFRWFDEPLRGEVMDESLDVLIDEIASDQAGTLERGALCALADLIARHVREAASPAAALLPAIRAA